jgi:type I restriction enzyme, R subunit
LISQGHGAEWEYSEKPAIEQLIKMGYEYKSNQQLKLERDDFNQGLLLQRLRKGIKKINPWIDEEGIQDAISRLQKFETAIAIDANEMAYARMMGLSRAYLQPITVPNLEEGNKPSTVKFFDFDSIGNNDFLVTRQFWLWGHKEQVFPDIVLFINGIPLVVIECKSPTEKNPITQAIMKNLTTYQQRNTGYEKMFYYNQILVATCGSQAVYAPTYAEPSQYKEWVDPYPYSIEEIESRFGKARKQEILIACMFEKGHFLDLIYNFISFETDAGEKIKKLAKYQQYRAVVKSLSKLESGKTSTEKGGVIWHTQGSGKSLTMLWFALQLKRKYENATILVVTDRKQLDKQIYMKFRNCGFASPEKAKDKDDLKTLLTNAKGKTIMATVFKFLRKKATAISFEPIFVLVDEGHRTQYGVTSSDMRIALPNAIFYAYTGTPLMKNERTRQVFGDYIDKYKLKESEADGSTVPIYYENRLTELSVGDESVDVVFERMFKHLDKESREEIKKRYANHTAIASAPDRIEKICLDMLKHYENVIRPNGFKAMIVAPSREAAVTYKEQLDRLSAPLSKIIMTSDPAKDIQKGWNKYELTEKEKEMYEERFNLPIAEEPLSILIVVDMLLTGFDSPILQVLYLDQTLKEHTLLQAIARVNRPYKETKTHGLIIDYWGISKNLREAFELYDDIDVENSLRPLDDQKELLKEQHKRVMSYFANLPYRNDLEEAVKILEPEDIQEQFNYDFKQFSKTMDTVLPDPITNQYREDMSFLANVRAATRTAYFNENFSLEGYGEKVKKLIEESVKASETIKLIPPTKIDNKNFMKLVNSYGSNQTRASIIEHKIGKVIEDEEQTDPEFYKSLRDRLERLIAEQRDKKFADAQEFRKLQMLLDELFAQEEKSKALGFNVRVQFAIFNILQKVTGVFDTAKRLTFEIHNALQPLKVIDWRQKDNVQKKMRVTVKDILYASNVQKDVNEIAARIVDLLKVHPD